MEQKEMIETLTKVLKTATVLENEPMKRHTTFRIGGNADVYIKAEEIEDIKEVITFASKHGIPLTVIGNGSNVLVRDKGIRGVVLEVDKTETSFKGQKDSMQITVRCRRKTNSSCSRM